MRARLDRVTDDAEFDPKRVLVVDDDEAMLRTNVRVLRAHGFRPIGITDPHEALEEVERALPCVVVVDLAMPEMSGLEFVTRLRARHGRECPPVVLVSANLVQLAPAEQIMFDVLFPKPYGVDGFIRWIAKLACSHVDRRKAPSHVGYSHAGHEEGSALEPGAEDGES